MRSPVYPYLALFAALSACRVAGQPAAPTPARLPVKEVTVFKDGHAFVLHSGKLPVTEDATVLLDHLPVPVLGTFWPYSADRSLRLASVTASPRQVKVDRPATTVPDLLMANPGAEVRITQTDGKVAVGKVVGIPEPERKIDSPAGLQDPARGFGGFGGGGGFPGSPVLVADTLLLKTSEGVTALPLRLIQTVTFKGEYRKQVTETENRNLLTLKLERTPAEKSAEVGLFYLQKGIRWIPNYRVDIDGKGNAMVELQATLINEMVDLDDVTANLVIGVPNFFFKDSPDPISLQQTFPQLSRYFQPDSQTGFAFSNAIMSQGGMGGFGGAPARRCGEEGEDAPEEGAQCQAAPPPLESISVDKNEDLFVFTARHVTLKKGQTMALPIAKVSVHYRDVYAVELPLAPPQEVNRGLNVEQQAELARLLRAPRAQHRIRLTNSGMYPLTTAPALVVSGDRVISQGMMTYTPVGGESDLTLTTSPDIQVTRSDRELKRTPNVENIYGSSLSRIDVQGTVTLKNLRGPAVDLEVTRYVLGNVESATRDGRVDRINVFEDDSFFAGELKPAWWSYYSWPSWWFYRNRVDKVSWKVHLEPGDPVELGYLWNYYISP
jgi:hypothetical protein